MEILEFKDRTNWESLLYSFCTHFTTAEVSKVMDSMAAWQFAQPEHMASYVSGSAWLTLDLWLAVFGPAATFDRLVGLLKEYYSIRKNEPGKCKTFSKYIYGIIFNFSCISRM
jgi:hypothetical protein